MCQHRYFHSFQYLWDIYLVTSALDHPIVTPSIFRLQGEQAFLVATDSCTACWLVNLHKDLKTSGVFISSASFIYDCSKLYAIRLSIDPLRICFGDGHLTEYYAIDDVLVVVPLDGHFVNKNQFFISQCERRSVQWKMAAKSPQRAMVVLQSSPEIGAL